MLNKIYIAVAGIFALLFGWLKITQAQRDKARVKAEKEAQARIAENIRNKQGVAVLGAQIKAKNEAQNVETENNANRGNRPVGNFGDKRMQDDS